MDLVQVICGWVFSTDRTQVLLVNNIGGTWSVPGGRVEPGELLPDAVIREVREEAGLDVRVNRLLAIGEGFKTSRPAKVLFFNFLVDPVDPAQMPRVVQPDEISEVRWVDADEVQTFLPYLPMHPHALLQAEQVLIYPTTTNIP